MEEQTDAKYPQVNEPEVKFKLISDRIVRQIINEDINEPMVEISGYDLQINFNMKYLKSVEEIDAACKGIGDLFREVIVSKLLEQQKPKE